MTPAARVLLWAVALVVTAAVMRDTAIEVTPEGASVTVETPMRLSKDSSLVHIDTSADTDDTITEEDDDEEAGEGAGESSLLESDADADADDEVDADDDEGEDDSDDAGLVVASAKGKCSRRRHGGTCEFRRRRDPTVDAPGEEMTDLDSANGPGCRRRRHGGECNYRRRREGAPEVGACAATDDPSHGSHAAETCTRRRRHGHCEFRRRRHGETGMTDVHEIGCRRRRRHGTCSFRRRREGATGAPAGETAVDLDSPDAPGCRRRRRHGECNFRRRSGGCEGAAAAETCVDANACSPA